MRNAKFNAAFLCILLFFFSFEHGLIAFWGGFSYVDEIMAIFFIASIMIKLSKTQGRCFKKWEIVIILSGIFIVLFGLVCNLESGLIHNWFYIFVDVISSSKVWLSYFWLISLNRDKDYLDSVLKYSIKIAHVLIILMIMCYCISLFINTGMISTDWHKIPSYQFIFNGPGNFSKLFYFILPLLTAGLNYRNERIDYLFIFLTLLLWVTSGRSRAVAFVFIYIALFYIYIFNKTQNKEKRSFSIRIEYILALVGFSIVLTWKQISYYFGRSTEPRSILLRYGLKTMIRYFPFGSGFGTFGSDVAAKEYSPLYIQYGLNTHYGMSQTNTAYLNDNYWPMIFAQFGLIATLVNVFGIGYFVIKTIIECKHNRYYFLAITYANGVLLLSSIASKSYSEFSSMSVFLLIAILVKRMRLENENEY